MQNYRILLKFPKRDPRILTRRYIEKGNIYLYSTFLTVFQNKNLIFCSNQLTSRTKKKKNSSQNYRILLKFPLKFLPKFQQFRDPLQQTTLKTETLAFSRAKRDRQKRTIWFFSLDING